MTDETTLFIPRSSKNSLQQICILRRLEAEMSQEAQHEASQAFLYITYSG